MSSIEEVSARFLGFAILDYLTIFNSGHSGTKLLAITEIVVRRCLPVRSCDGLHPVAAIGVALYARRAKKGSSCLSIFFAVLTALSASPFDCGK